MDLLQSYQTVRMCLQLLAIEKRLRCLSCEKKKQVNVFDTPGNVCVNLFINQFFC